MKTLFQNRIRIMPTLIFAGAVVLVIESMTSRTGLGNAGTEQTLAVAFLFGALALSYDLLLGFTGLLSFGHALFYAIGAYVTAIMINTAHWPVIISGLFAMLVSGVVALLVGAGCLKTKGITFAMVTLAFGEAGVVIVSKNVHGLTGGDNGLPLNTAHIPAFLVTVANTRYLLWIAMAVLAIVYLCVWWLTESSAGKVFAALRDNELRVQVLGLNPNRFKLLSFVVAGVLASLVGVAMLLINGGASPRMGSSDTTIALLLMVILGGAATRWGAVFGGILYSILTTRLQDLNQGSILKSIPKIISGPLSEPTFLLGTLFILVVMFAPGGFSGLYYRLTHRRARIRK
jgi:branched-chain amino acid transport system permease protein